MFAGTGYLLSCPFSAAADSRIRLAATGDGAAIVDGRGEIVGEGPGIARLILQQDVVVAEAASPGPTLTVHGEPEAARARDNHAVAAGSLHSLRRRTGEGLPHVVCIGIIQLSPDRSRYPSGRRHGCGDSGGQFGAALRGDCGVQCPPPEVPHFSLTI